MCTKWFSDGDVHKYFNPYGSPYDAYINYMNVLADFRLRLENRGSHSATLPVLVKEPDAVVPEPVKKGKKAGKEIKPVTKVKKNSTAKPVLKKKDAPKKPR